jgi:ubiquinone/menaquinone biosynthesis C-methylase UbiE
MKKSSSDFHFKGMSFLFKIRDFFLPRKNVLREVGIKPGSHVLDYGCGPGSYIIPLETLIGQTGKIYALDIHPLAIQKVQRIVEKKSLTNIETIQSDCQTGLPDQSMDVVLLYDTLHELNDPEKVFMEIHRILKPDGILSLSDHHMKEDEIQSRVTDLGSFKLVKRGKKTFSYSKAG